MFFAETLNTIIEIQPRLERPTSEALEIIRPNFHLGWNLLLAIIPLVLALIIFRPSSASPKMGDLPLMMLFIIFLPNAPSVLTDVTHLVDKIRSMPALPFWAACLMMVEFFLYFFIGMQSFTISMMLWERNLREQGLRWLILPVECLMIVLSAVGMYLGRFDRFNSWDIVTDPERLVDHSLREAIRHQPQMTTLMFISIVAIIYYLTKTVNMVVIALLQPLPDNHQDPHSVLNWRKVFRTFQGTVDESG